MSHSLLGKKITWLVNGNEGFGIKRTVLDLSQKAAENEVKVSLLTVSNRYEFNENKIPGIHYDSLGVENLEKFHGGAFKKLKTFIKNLFVNFLIIFKLANWLRREKIDALHVVPNNLVLVSALSTLGSRTKVIWEMPNAISDDYPLKINKLLYTFVCKISQCIILANSNFTAGTIKNKFLKPYCFHLGFDQKKFNPAQKKPSDKLDSIINKDDFVMGLFARFLDDKGQRRMIEVMDLLVPKYPNLKLLLVGAEPNSEYVHRLKRLIEERSLNSNIFIFNRTDDLSSFYYYTDITLNIRLSAEPFGLSVVESMAMGVPVMAHSLGGPSETIINNETGWLLDEISCFSIANKLTSIMEDKVSLNKITAFCEQYAIERFSLEVVWENYEKIVTKYL
jgi:glycosyltransferase involved in cell wall biosynthesis